MEKVIKARKKYVCDHCGRDINIGDKYHFGKGKEPKFDDDFERQIGIHYYQYRLCFNRDVCTEWKGEGL